MTASEALLLARRAPWRSFLPRPAQCEPKVRPGQASSLLLGARRLVLATILSLTGSVSLATWHPSLGLTLVCEMQKVIGFQKWALFS